MSTRAAICAEAQSWQDVPYHHGQASRYGCDCIGLIVAVARNLHFLPADYQPAPYSHQWQLHNTVSLLAQGVEAAGCTPVPLASRQPGDIVLFQFGLCASHAGILLPEGRFAHAKLGDRVLCQRLTTAYVKRLTHCYSFPGVDEHAIR